MIFDDTTIGNILLKEHYITEEDLALAKTYAQENVTSLLDALVTMNLMTKSIYGQAMAEQVGAPYIDLKKEKIDVDILEMIPEVMARAAGVIAFKQGDAGVHVGMIQPQDKSILHMLEKRFGQPVIPFFITEQDFRSAMDQYRPGMEDVFGNILNRCDIHISRI